MPELHRLYLQPCEICLVSSTMRAKNVLQLYWHTILQLIRPAGPEVMIFLDSPGLYITMFKSQLASYLCCGWPQMAIPPAKHRNGLV